VAIVGVISTSIRALRDSCFELLLNQWTVVLVSSLAETSSVIFSAEEYASCSSANLAEVSANSSASRESFAEDGGAEVAVTFVSASVTVAEMQPARAKHMAAILFILFMVQQLPPPPGIASRIQGAANASGEMLIENYWVLTGNNEAFIRCACFDNSCN